MFKCNQITWKWHRFVEYPYFVNLVPIQTYGNPEYVHIVFFSQYYLAVWLNVLLWTDSRLAFTCGQLVMGLYLPIPFSFCKMWLLCLLQIALTHALSKCIRPSLITANLWNQFIISIYNFSEAPLWSYAL